MSNLSDTPFFSQLPQAGLILIEGPEAAKFLQGQVTCDVRELESQQWRQGAQCSVKGRVLSSFCALQLNSETIALRVNASNVDATIASLGKYIVFSKAKLANASQAYCLFGIYTEQLPHLANFSGHQLAPGHWANSGDSYLLRLDQHRYEYWVPIAQQEASLNELRTHYEAANENAWTLQQIRAGIADITSATREQFTPQELNYPLINAVNFRKGCYTGQEIVARLHYRGKQKRHAYRYLLNTTQLPEPGTALLSTNGENAGHILNCALNEQNQVELLASVFDEYSEAVFISGHGEKLQRLPLPYAIPSADDSHSAE